MRDDPTVVRLVLRAREGDQRAWEAIVERYAPLVYGICRRYELSGPDIDDVGAYVWLRLVERLRLIREPAALPGWLATTTRHRCLRQIQERRRHTPVPGDAAVLDEPDAGDEDWLLVQERQAALRVAFAALPDNCRQLLSMLFSDPPTPYAEISARVGTPIGAIGPTRQRCLEKLRRSPSLAALAEPSPSLGSPS